MLVLALEQDGAAEPLRQQGGVLERGLARDLVDPRKQNFFQVVGRHRSTTLAKAGGRLRPTSQSSSTARPRGRLLQEIRGARLRARTEGFQE